MLASSVSLEDTRDTDSLVDTPEPTEYIGETPVKGQTLCPGHPARKNPSPVYRNLTLVPCQNLFRGSDFCPKTSSPPLTRQAVKNSHQDCLLRPSRPKKRPEVRTHTYVGSDHLRDHWVRFGPIRLTSGRTGHGRPGHGPRGLPCSDGLRVGVGKMSFWT